MSKPIISIFDLSTNETIEREMNDQEFAAWQTEKERGEAEIKAKEEAAQAKTALLEKLGISQEEAKLLLS